MPELPEVQTVCDVMRPQIVGKRIENIRIEEEKVIAGADVDKFKKCLIGAAFEAVNRRGKYILLLLDKGRRLTIHLRMTGCLLVAPAGYPAEKHTHVTFELEGGQELRFIDQRKFGRMWLTEACGKVPGLDALGPEPFDKALTAEYLKERIGNLHRKIKDCLLDQHLVAGIGNIYSDEILFRAGIHPAREACSLTEAAYKRLAAQIPDTMQYYVDKNRIDAQTYLKTGGREYQNTPYLQVYGRAGKACLVCGERLVKARVAGRGSVYCPCCQRLDETT